MRARKDLWPESIHCIVCGTMAPAHRTVALILLAALMVVAAPAAARAQGWDMALTGGFVANGLVDREYALGNVPGRPTRVVVRQTDEESSVSVGIGMFAQVYHTRHDFIAPLSVGLGLRSDARATVYMGSALRFGPHASFTAGVAIGPVATLPPGLSEGSSVADTNQLTNLGARTTASWFAGLTYTFASIH
jgi:hypothetical protein